ncbi:pilus assembly protein PilM [Thermodesulfobacteriota bacterium]
MQSLRYRYPIGLDISEKEIYAAQLKQTHNKFEVRALFHRQLNGEAEREDGGDYKNSLPLLLKEIAKYRQISGKRVVLHLPSQNIFSFPIRFRVNNDESLDEAILKTSKEYLSFPIEEAILDYPSLIQNSTTDSREYKGIITAVKKQYLENLLKLFKQAGMVVEAIDYPVCSMIRLHQYLYGAIENPIMLTHIGHSQSLLAVITEEGILAERTVHWGMKNLQRKIMTNLELSDDEAKAKLLLKNYGLIYETQKNSESNGTEGREHEDVDNMYRVIHQILSPYLEELIDEYHKMIGYLSSEQGNVLFEGIYVYGPGALIHHLNGYIEGRLRIPAVIVNPLENGRLEGDAMTFGDSEGTPFALALGLAMRKVTWL